MLGFRSWADLATADQMMGSAANVRTFLAKLDEASRDGAAPRARADSRVCAQPPARSCGDRHHQPRLLVRAVSPLRLSTSTRSPCGLTSPIRRSRPAFSRPPRGCSRSSSAPPTAPAWDPAVSVFEVFEDGKLVGRFYLDMHPREGKDKWFSAAPVVTGVRGRYLPEAALICNFPGGDDERSGPAAVLRRGHVLPRIRPPDACHSRRTHRVGRSLGLRHRRRLHRSAIADARGILPRREAAAVLREALRDAAKSCPPRSSRK